MTLFQEMVRQKVGVTWDCTNGVIAASCEDDVIAAATESGCIGLIIGMESGNREILRRIRKPGTVEREHRPVVQWIQQIIVELRRKHLLDQMMRQLSAAAVCKQDVRVIRERNRTGEALPVLRFGQVRLRTKCVGGQAGAGEIKSVFFHALISRGVIAHELHKLSMPSMVPACMVHKHERTVAGNELDAVSFTISLHAGRKILGA